MAYQYQTNGILPMCARLCNAVSKSINNIQTTQVNIAEHKFYGIMIITKAQTHKIDYLRFPQSKISQNV